MCLNRDQVHLLDMFVYSNNIVAPLRIFTSSMYILPTNLDPAAPNLANVGRTVVPDSEFGNISRYHLCRLKS